MVGAVPNEFFFLSNFGNRRKKPSHPLSDPSYVTEEIKRAFPSTRSPLAESQFFGPHLFKTGPPECLLGKADPRYLFALCFLPGGGPLAWLPTVRETRRGALLGPVPPPPPAKPPSKKPPVFL